MRIIHLLRKPLSEGTVASNTLKHGVGGINIEASRIGTTDYFGGGSKMSSSGHTLSKFDPYEKGSGWVAGSVSGRWPSNLILQHLDGCQCDGVKRVPSNGNFPAQQKTTSWKMASKGKALTPDRTYRQGGVETVSNWICEPGCPVKALDEQGGPRRSGSGGKMEGGFWDLSGKERCFTPYGDTGGASRFYKQVGGGK